MMLIMLFCVVVFGFAIYGLTLLIMKPFENKSNKVISLLEERFARGEINEEEFQEKKKLLINK